ncbi:MAG TPA: hypothetical protein VFU88_15380 [Ktedonobacterales bacterium]|nr:hypothetical protein [Ktedonobacterales bacterium]
MAMQQQDGRPAAPAPSNGGSPHAPPPAAPAPMRAAATPGITVSGLGGMGTRGGVPLSVPLPFLLTGIGAAALFGLALPWLAADATAGPLAPHVLALVHVATLGWLTMIILGASLQLAPVVLVAPLRATRLVRWEYPVFVTGVAILVSGFWIMQPLAIAAGGTLVLVAIGHHVAVLWMTIASARQRPLTARYLAAAAGYLCAVVALGLTAALDLRLGFLGTGLGRVLPAHIALGVAGWLTCTLMGVSYTLVRMFALAHSHDDRLGRWVFALLNGGLLTMAAGFVMGIGALVAAGGAVFCGAVWLFAYDYRRMLRARRRKPLDVTQRHGIAAVAWLVILTPVGVAVVVSGQTTPPLLFALGLAAFVGWLGQSTVGYLYKIVPFLLWQERYAPLVGRRQVPLMRDMIHSRWAEASWWLINVGLLCAVLCAPAGWLWPLRLACAALGAGLALAAANVFAVLRR